MSNDISVSKRIVTYIREKGLSVDEVSAATNVPRERLVDENVIFDALEFLELCNYLNLEPKELKM